MLRAASFVWVIWLLTGIAVAQERPAPAPADNSSSIATDEAPDDQRPPAKPETPTEPDAEPTGQAQPDEAAEADQADEQPAKEATEEIAEEQGEMFGPPPPPQWYVLSESDQEYAACKLALAMLGTSYSEEPALRDDDNPECGIARPILVQKILPDLVLEGGAVMRCDTARALGLWSRDFLRPASAMLPDAPRVTSLQLGTTYDCRGRVGTGDAQPKLSEHAYGNAIDIAAFTFDNGETLTVQPRTDSGDMAESFQIAVQKAGCLFFSTVLGPGSNEAHSDHLHFDVAVRNGGWRLCQ